MWIAAATIQTSNPWNLSRCRYRCNMVTVPLQTGPLYSSVRMGVFNPRKHLLLAEVRRSGLLNLFLFINNFVGGYITLVRYIQDSTACEPLGTNHERRD
jgi:hypothetical protein